MCYGGSLAMRVMVQPQTLKLSNKKSKGQIWCVGGIILKGFPSPRWLEMKWHWQDIAVSHITFPSRARFGVHPVLPDLIPSLQGHVNTADMRRGMAEKILRWKERMARSSIAGLLPGPRGGGGGLCKIDSVLKLHELPPHEFLWW